MVRIAWRMLTQRPASMVATFLALTIAVVVVTGCGVILDSGIRYHGTVSRYAAAPVLVATTRLTVTDGSGENADTETYPLADRAALPTTLRAAIAATPGVRDAINDTAVVSQVITSTAPVAVQLHPWSAAALTPFQLVTGEEPTGEDDLVLTEPMATKLGAGVGQRVRLAVAEGSQVFTVAGIASPDPGAREPGGDGTIFLSDTRLAALSGGAVQVIGVFGGTNVATARLAAEVRSVLNTMAHRPAGAYPQVYTGSDRGEVESLAVGNARDFVIAVAGTFGGSALIIAILVIAGSIGLSVAQRHRDIALLRAIAATPRQVRRIVVREAIALGLLAAGVGVWPGLATAGWLRGQFVDRGMVPSDFVTQLSWLPPVVASASALLIAVVAAWTASLRPSRIRPSQALAETAVERHGIGAVRALLGLAFLAGGITLAIVSASSTGDSAAGVAVATVFALVTAVAFLGPLLIRGAAAIAAPVLRRFGATGRLAAATTSTSSAQLATVLSALVLAVGLGGSLWFVQTSEEHAAAQQAHAGLLANYVITAAPAGLSPALTTRLLAIHGVRAATGLVRSTWLTADDGGDAYPIQGLDTTGSATTVDLDVTQGSITDLHGRTVAVDTLTAQALHLYVGGQLRGWFGDGAPSDLRVVAIYRRGLGFAPLTVPRELLAPHTDTARDDLVLLNLDAARPDLPTQIRRQLSTQEPGSTLLARNAYQVVLGRGLLQNAWTEKIVTAVLLVYVAIAAANTLVMYAFGRRREFAVLRLAGTTRRQVLHMVSLEQAMLLGITLVVGLTIAAVTLIPMVKGTTGSTTPFIPVSGWIAVIGGTICLGVLATALPSRRALHMQPVEAIGTRE